MSLLAEDLGWEWVANLVGEVWLVDNVFVHRLDTPDCSFNLVLPYQSELCGAWIEVPQAEMFVVAAGKYRKNMDWFVRRRILTLIGDHRMQGEKCSDAGIVAFPVVEKDNWGAIDRTTAWT